MGKHVFEFLDCVYYKCLFPNVMEICQTVLLHFFIAHAKDIKNAYFIFLKIVIDFERFPDPGNQVLI